MRDVWISLGGALVGAFFGAIIALWLDHIKTPNLSMGVREPDDDPVNKRRFLILKVENRERTGISKFLQWNRPALHCRVLLEFLDPKTEKQLFAIQARWVSAAEPLFPTGPGQGVFLPALAIAAETETVLRDDERPLNVAIKYEGSKDFWGFNNASYLHNTKNPEWVLQADKVKVRAHLKCDSIVEKTWDFIIHNPDNTIASFEIQKV